MSATIKDTEQNTVVWAELIYNLTLTRRCVEVFHCVPCSHWNLFLLAYCYPCLSFCVGTSYSLIRVYNMVGSVCVESHIVKLWFYFLNPCFALFCSSFYWSSQDFHKNNVIFAWKIYLCSLLNSLSRHSNWA